MADKPHDDHSKDVPVERDPSKKSFWRARNIFLLFMTAFAPVAGKAAWDGSTKFFADHDALLKRVERSEESVTHLRESVKTTALWGALAEERNQTTQLRIEVEVLKRLFDREFARHPQVQKKDEDELIPIPQMPMLIPAPPLLVPKPAPKAEPKSPAQLFKELEEPKKFYDHKQYKQDLEQRYPAPGQEKK